MNITHKTALITGASSGIGYATALLLAEKGYNIIALARREERLKQLINTIQNDYKDVSAVYYVCDIMDTKAINSVFESIKECTLDAVINNAGIAKGMDMMQNASWEDIEMMIQTNVIGATKVIHSALPMLIKSKGTLVNISSIAATMPYSGGSTYGATKAYIKTLSEYLRMDMLNTKCRIINIEPGIVHTEFRAVRMNESTNKADEYYTAIPSIKPLDIANAIYYALSQPDYVNIDSVLVSATDWARPGFYSK